MTLQGRVDEEQVAKTYLLLLLLERQPDNFCQFCILACPFCQEPNQSFCILSFSFRICPLAMLRDLQRLLRDIIKIELRRKQHDITDDCHFQF